MTRRMCSRRVMAKLMALFGMALAGGLLVILAPSPPADAQTVRTVGNESVDDIIAAANANARPACGLTADRLAAMMLAPVFHETGAVNTPGTAPSPMTLSRWDNQDGLYAFGSKSTAYPRAFWHPGVGMWQFDSAGGWNLTAAGAIDTRSSGSTAARVMADRFCAASTAPTIDRMKYAWSPWYACVAGTTNVCVDRFNEMFVSGTFTNIRRDPAVGRLGGMVVRTCRIGGTTDVTCYRVDPAAAQGYRAWAAPNAGPTPITAPFYVFTQGDTEYRYWLAADTGYGSTVRAFKRVTANARTSLTWQLTSPSVSICDMTVSWGDCVPFGSLDAVSPAGPGLAVVAGWAIDPDTVSPISVHVYTNGRLTGWPANTSRPDVGRAYPGYGDNHGFNATVELDPGANQICVYAINTGAGSGNPLLGCRTVTSG
jgi:hypothetical protein